jgi:hypothetical protein
MRSGLASRILDRGEALVRVRGGLLAALATGAVALTAWGAAREGGLAAASEAALGIVVPMAVVLGAVATGGVVSPELRTGAAMLWVQKQGGGLPTYLLRLAERVILGWILVLALVGAQAGAIALMAGGGSGSRFLLQAVPLALFLIPMGAAVTWVMSSAGVQGDAALALLLLPLWILAGSLPEVLASMPNGVTTVLEATAPPVALLAALPRTAEGGGPTVLAVGQYLLWLAAVTVAGAALLSSRLRRPFSAGASR